MKLGRMKKIFICVLAALVLQIGFGWNIDFTYGATAKRPVIKVYSPSVAALNVKTTSASKHKGLQIKYSRYSSFKSPHYKIVKTTGKLNRTIKSLTGGKKYYVKVRSYTLKKSKRIYTSWSKTKSVTVKKKVVSEASDGLTSCYVNAWKINLETSKKSTDKYKTNPAKYTLPYMASVKVDSYESKYSSKGWVKVVYQGNTFYTYVNPSVDASPFTTAEHKFQYSTYSSECKTTFQEKVVRRAMKIIDERMITGYDYDHKTYRVSQGDDRSKLDCVNFARFVVNPIFGADVVSVTPKKVYSDGVNSRVFTVGGKTYTAKKIGKISNLKPGDIICLDETTSTSGVDHVGVYLGNGDFIEVAGQIPGSKNGGGLVSPLRGRNAKNFVCGVRYSVK